MSSKELRKGRELLYEMRDSMVNFRASFPSVLERSKDMHARTILAQIDLIEIEMDRIEEIDHQEQLEYERSMGDDL